MYEKSKRLMIQQKLNKNKRKLEKTVLEISKKHSPSYLKFNDKEFVKKYEKRIFDLFQNRLKYPISMFDRSSVLDLGSGTGERGVFYSKWGANLTCVDFNPISIKRHKQLLKQFKLDESKISFFNQSVYDFENPHDTKFDLTISSGVISHLPDPKMAFKKQTQFLKKGGFTMVSCLNSAGNFHMNLQRYGLFVLSQSKKKSIEALTPFLFKDYLIRAEKYGGRLINSIISDNYRNPKVASFSTRDILEMFKENNMQFYSSWPPISPDFVADSTSRDYLDYAKLKSLNFISKFESNWMISTEDDLKKFDSYNSHYSKFDQKISLLCKIFSDVNQNNVKTIKEENVDDLTNELVTTIEEQNSEYDKWTRTLSLFINEVMDYVKIINSEQSLKEIQQKIKTYKILFAGNSGLPTIYYMGYKR